LLLQALQVDIAIVLKHRKPDVMPTLKLLHWRHLLTLAALVLVPMVSHADGFAVDKVYHPYVQPLERELEFRSILLSDDDDELNRTQLHRLGLGRSFTDRIFAEFYLIWGKESGGSLSLEAYEVELKWQLTEQGEYFADWGLLFELENERDDDIWEYSTAVLVEKEFGQWAGTVNLAAIYEWGDDIENEWESQISSQLRYRYSRAFEPAVEYYAGDSSKGFGPVALGAVRFSGARKLRWELGVIFGLDSESPDQTYRAMLEYEF
jgi:hypothetical protein